MSTINKFFGTYKKAISDYMNNHMKDDVCEMEIFDEGLTPDWVKEYLNNDIY